MDAPIDFELPQAPAHLIRRAHQVAVALFAEEAAGLDITPVQFAILHALRDSPGEDQVSLAARVAFDAATSGSVIGRLEAKGWLRREPDRQDRRRKRLWLTPEGDAAARAMVAVAARVQVRLAAPLTQPERDELVRLLHKLVDGHTGARSG